MNEIIIPNRMTGVGFKLLLRATNGGGYKVHAMVYWDLKEELIDDLPVIRKLKISARPMTGSTSRGDFLDTLIEESIIGFNRNLKKGGSFDQECLALGKSGFVGVVGNYIRENFKDILSNKSDGRKIELQLDSKNRLSSNYKEQLINGETI